MKDFTNTIDHCSLKNFCSINIFLKCLIWSVQAPKFLLFLSEEIPETKISLIFRIGIDEKDLNSYDRSWLSEKLLFSKNFPKMSYLVFTDSQSFDLHVRSGIEAEDFANFSKYE